MLVRNIHAKHLWLGKRPVTDSTVAPIKQVSLLSLCHWASRSHHRYSFEDISSFSAAVKTAKPIMGANRKATENKTELLFYISINPVGA